MRFYRERFVLKAQKARRCAGCEGKETIHKGDQYYSCFGLDGKHPVSYSLCMPCRDHLSACKECNEAWMEGDCSYTWECRRETDLQTWYRDKKATPSTTEMTQQGALEAFKR